MDRADNDTGDANAPDPALRRTADAVVAAASEVHAQLGPGHAEAVYERAMSIELEARRLKFERQVILPVRYRGKPVGELWLDYVVEDAVLVELGAGHEIGLINEAHCRAYLRASGHRLAVLVHFNVVSIVDGLRLVSA